MKHYILTLGVMPIGTTELEKADAPMGVVFGQIKCHENDFGYDEIKAYCQAKDIEVTVYPEDKLILTRHIPELKVIDESGIEIKGLTTSIECMDGEGSEVFIVGVPYPFYEQEFPHHVESYHNLLNDF